MNELEQNILDAIRACDRKVLESPGTNEKLREEFSSSYNEVIHIISNFNDDNKGGNKRNVRHLQQDIGTTTIIKNIVRGGNVDIQAVRGFSKPYLVDGNQLNRTELLAIKKQLQKIYTEMTGMSLSSFPLKFFRVAILIIMQPIRFSHFDRQIRYQC
jgi:hypothetical protein